MSRQQPEYRFQCLLVKHLEARLMPGVYCNAMPFGEYRTDATAARLKRMGVKPGMGDLFFLDQGLAFSLELKIAPNGQSDTQKRFEKDWRRAGGTYAVVYTLDQALAQLQVWGLVRPDVSARAA